MLKTLKHLSFIIVSLAVIFTFATAQNYLQLGIAILLYPFLAYIAYRLFVRRNYHEPAMSTEPVNTAQPGKVETLEPQKDDTGVADMDKREFLKMIGAAGVSLFLFSIFTRRSEALFFGRTLGSGVTALEDVNGNKVNPSERQPTDGYQISEIDENDITYYGFINKEGAWYIMKESFEEGSYRYSKGDSNFPGNWINRNSLSYDYFHNVFA